MPSFPRPCSTSVLKPQPQANTLNAIAPQSTDAAAERKARHLAVCQELIDLGMKLARAAAQQGLGAWENAAQPDQPPDTSPTTTPDPNLAFARLSRSVRQSVALESQIAADAFNRPADPATNTYSEERLQEISDVLHKGTLQDILTHLTENQPNRRELGQILPAVIEDTIAAHPDQSLPTHFAIACQALNLTPPDPPDRWPRP